MEQEMILELLEKLAADASWCEDADLRAAIASLTGFNLIEY
ncbi:hypothetical protein [Eubacterium sp. 1001713B170207_170306_E7]|nr:hypothetical protein [Eubacterium sp. 1001713B170207_170306_E7]